MKSTRLASILMTAGLVSAGTIYNITDLGSLGGTSAAAFGLNANGLAVGSATTAFGYAHAFSSSGSGITDLTLNTAASEGIAAGVNNKGTIAGTAYMGGQAYATEWSNGSAAAVGGAGSFAMAINNSGQVAGMMTVGGQGHAFVTINGVAFDMGTIGGSWSSAYAVNDSGEVAGYGMTGSGVFRGYEWSQTTGYTVMGTLGGWNSYAMAINNQGEVAGSAQTSAGYMHAVVSQNGSLTDLGTLGGTNSYAYGVNSSGIVVGYSCINSLGVMHAFVEENGVMFDLNHLVEPSSGWVLNEAYAINASGEIAGSGMLNGIEQAFLLDPSEHDFSAARVLGDPAVPEPATWTMFAIGLAAVVSSRIRLRLPRRRRRPQPERSQSDASHR